MFIIKERNQRQNRYFSIESMFEIGVKKKIHQNVHQNRKQSLQTRYSFLPL